MKTKQTYGLHRSGRKEPVFYVGENGKGRELPGKHGMTWLGKLKKGDTVISTAGHSMDRVPVDIAERGVNVRVVNWHKSGIDKGLDPIEIAVKASLLVDGASYEFFPRRDLVPLRRYVTVRNALLDYRKAAMNQFRALERNTGLPMGKWEPDLCEAAEECEENMAKNEKKIERGYDQVDEETGEVTKVDEGLVKLAKKTPDCRAFNVAFGMENGWIMAARYVSAVGDVRRFPMFSSLMKYSGQHTVEGKAPKRRRGSPVDWSPEARTVLWLTVTSCIKSSVAAVCDPYYEFREEELAAHDTKCPGCKHKQGHCGAMARRKVTKLLLKKFYNLAGGTGKIGDNVPKGAEVPEGKKAKAKKAAA